MSYISSQLEKLAEARCKEGEGVKTSRIIPLLNSKVLVWLTVTCEAAA